MQRSDSPLGEISRKYYFGITILVGYYFKVILLKKGITFQKFQNFEKYYLFSTYSKLFKTWYYFRFLVLLLSDFPLDKYTCWFDYTFQNKIYGLMSYSIEIKRSCLRTKVYENKILLQVIFLKIKIKCWIIHLLFLCRLLICCVTSDFWQNCSEQSEQPNGFSPVCSWRIWYNKWFLCWKHFLLHK